MIAYLIVRLNIQLDLFAGEGADSMAQREQVSACILPVIRIHPELCFDYELGDIHDTP